MEIFITVAFTIAIQATAIVIGGGVLMIIHAIAKRVFK